MVDEHRITNPLWYEDLENIVRNNMVPEITRKQDLLVSLTSVQLANRRHERGGDSKAKPGTAAK